MVDSGRFSDAASSHRLGLLT